MKRYQLKKRKKILHDILQERYVLYIQPLKMLQKNCRTSVEVITYYRKFCKEYAMNTVINELEKDVSVVIFDLYVFEKICEAMQRWKRKKLQDVRVHIQISNITLLQNDLDKQIDVIIERYQVRCQDIALIVTPPRQLEDYCACIKMITTLHEKGYMMIMESDGRGLDFVAKAMFSMVKLSIDNFIENLETKRNTSYLSSFISWCQDEHIELMLNGISNEKQERQIQEIGCSYMEAPYLHNAIPLNEFELLLVGKLV